MSPPSLPCAKASFLNNSHASSSDKHPSLCCNSGTLAIIRVVVCNRVVITTILSSAPQLNVSRNFSHLAFSFSSAQTSSSTIRNFLLLNLLCRYSCNSCNVSSCVSVHPFSSIDLIIFFIISLTCKFSET
ncbi:hypothetical protein HanIR_Chr01g0049211 [Helianthus annuus]|nr:hypothetical protein HanIR_Chr01g0049211 [Helianthus annuus]